MAIFAAEHQDVREQLEEFFRLLKRAQNVFPANPAPPPTVTSGVVHDGKWLA